MRKISKKAWTIAGSIVAVAVIVLTTVLCVLFVPIKGSPNNSIWTPIDEYASTDYTTLYKEKGKDFKILQLTDIQISDLLGYGTNHAFGTAKKAIEEANPDLIILTGDQVWTGGTKFSQKRLVSELDSFGIPWAPVLGNHDGEGTMDLQALAESYMSAENCLFKKGPGNIGGVGNYIINIKEKDGDTERFVQSLYFFDSHAGRTYYDENGKKFGGYDFIQPAQIAWYEWAVKGLQAENKGENVESMMFMHIPLYQYKLADEALFMNGENRYENVADKKANTDLVEYIDGFNFETPCSAPIDSGMFEAIKRLDSTKAVFAGHDHVNNSILKYDGVKLVYGQKTGETCYARPKEEMNGGTLITLKANDTVEIEHKYIKIK